MNGDGERHVLDAIVAFVSGIGLRVRYGDVAGPTVLPGIALADGVLVVDPAGGLHPGDVLHEAGHLAVLPPTERARADRRLASSAGDEMAAIAWSYAAAVHLGLPAAVVFHSDGYRDGSAALVENFSAGRWVGVPMLEWFGMTVDVRRAHDLGVDPYPAMLTWLRTGETP